MKSFEEKASKLIRKLEKVFSIGSCTVTVHDNGLAVFHVKHSNIYMSVSYIVAVEGFKVKRSLSDILEQFGTFTRPVK